MGTMKMSYGWDQGGSDFKSYFAEYAFLASAADNFQKEKLYFTLTSKKSLNKLSKSRMLCPKSFWPVSI